MQTLNKEYEAMVLFKPETSDESIADSVKKVEELVVQYDGKLYRSDRWAKRNLAYPISKFTEGLYVIHRFRAPKEIVPGLDYLFKYHEDVLRFLITDYTEKVERAAKKKRTVIGDEVKTEEEAS